MSAEEQRNAKKLNKFIDWFREVSAAVVLRVSAPKHDSQRWMRMLTEEFRSRHSDYRRSSGELPPTTQFAPDLSTTDSILPSSIELSEIQCDHSHRTTLDSNLMAMGDICRRCHDIHRLGRMYLTKDVNPYRCWRRGPAHQMVRGVDIRISLRTTLGTELSWDRFGSVATGSGEPSIIKWNGGDWKRSEKYKLKYVMNNRIQDSLNGTYRIRIDLLSQASSSVPPSIEQLSSQLKSTNSDILQNWYISRGIGGSMRSEQGNRIGLRKLMNGLRDAWVDGHSSAMRSMQDEGMPPLDPVENMGLLFVIATIPKQDETHMWRATLQEELESIVRRETPWRLILNPADGADARLDLIFDPARRIPLLHLPKGRGDVD